MNVPHPPSARRQRGMALITALVVAGVAVSIAFAVSTRDQVAIRHAQNLLAAGQARAHARGVELWARGVLRSDAEASVHDHYGEAWGRPLGPVEVVGGAVSGRIVDIEGRWNVNNLLAVAQDAGDGEGGPGAAGQGDGDGEPGAPAQGDGDGARPKARAPAEDTGRGAPGADEAARADDDAGEKAEDDAPEVDPEQLAVLECILRRIDAAPALAGAIIDWIDADDEPMGPSGAEDDWYLRRRPARRAANALLTDITELRLVRGMDEETFERLEPFIMAAPGKHTVNVNTASPELLACMVPAGALGALVAGRPWTDTADFAKLPALNAAPVPPNRLGVVSVLFEIESLVRLDRALLLTRTRVERREGGTTVVWRRRGWPDG